MSSDGRDLSKMVNRGVAWSAGAQTVIAVTDLISQLLVLALWVDPKDWGVASAAIAFYTLLDTAADFGVTSSLIQRDDHTVERISTVFWFNVFVSTALFAIVLVLGPLYGHLQDRPVIGWLLIAYGGKLMFQNVYAIPFALLRKELRFAEIAKARMTAHIAESIARIVFAALGATVWCWTLAALTRSFVFGVVIQIWHRFVPKLHFKPREVIDYLRFGLRTAASQILFRLYTSLDYAVVLYFFGDRANGIYALAAFIVLEPVKTISNVVIDVAFAAFAKQRHDHGGLVRQFVQFSRLNLIAVLPFVVLILLVIPEALRVFYGGGKWSVAELDLAGEAARVLCIVGALRALSFLGPPLLDGVGHPERTLRYMVSAAVLVPASFVLFARLFGGEIGMLSVAVAWAVGYPIAFGVLLYLIVKTIDLPLGHYMRASWGIAGCCLAGLLAGLAVSLAIPNASDLVRMLSIGGTALVVMGVFIVKWQKITPRSIRGAVAG